MRIPLSCLRCHPRACNARHCAGAYPELLEADWLGAHPRLSIAHLQTLGPQLAARPVASLLHDEDLFYKADRRTRSAPPLRGQNRVLRKPLGQAAHGCARSWRGAVSTAYVAHLASLCCGIGSTYCLLMRLGGLSCCAAPLGQNMRASALLPATQT